MILSWIRYIALSIFCFSTKYMIKKMMTLNSDNFNNNVLKSWLEL